MGSSMHMPGPYLNGMLLFMTSDDVCSCLLKAQDAAGTKSWRGLGAAVEDWGEVNTGKRAPAVFVLDLRMHKVIKVRAT